MEQKTPETLTVDEVLNRRTSLRRYADRPLSEEDVNAIIHGAMRAPTAGNMMMYSMIMVTDPEKKQRLSETCDHQPFIAQAPLVIVFVADMQRWFDFYQFSDVAGYCTENGLEFSGPDEGDLLLACSDALIAAQNAVIAAESRDIGSCYIGDIMENYEIHREMFKLPPWAFPIAMLCFGYYPDGQHPSPRTRYDRKYLVFENEYMRLDRDELSEMLGTRSGEFNINNKFRAKNQGQFTYARKTGAEYSVELARSVRAALQNWRGTPL